MKNRSLVAAVVSHFVVDYTGQVPAMMYPILVATLGLTYTNVGLAAALYWSVNGISQPIFGYLGDRIGPRFLVALGILVHGFGITLVARVWNLQSLLLFLVIAAVGSGMFHPLATSIASRSASGRRGTAMGIFFIGGNAGFALSPIVSAVALKAMGLDYALILIVPAILAAGVSLLLTRDSDQVGRASVTRVPVPDLPGSQDEDPVRGVVALVVVMLLRGSVYGGLAVLIPLLYSAAGLAVEVTGLALSLFLGGVALRALFGGVLADRFGKKPVVVTTLLAATPFVLLISAQPGSVSAQLATFVAGLMIGSSQTPTVMAVQEYIPRLLGAASGLALGFTFGSHATGQALSGVLADNLGIDLAMRWLALAPVLAAVVGLFLPGPLRPVGSLRG